MIAFKYPRCSLFIASGGGYMDSQQSSEPQEPQQFPRMKPPERHTDITTNSTAVFADICAGLTVAMTLIPQALSYATLATLPPIQGLYASIFPAIAYYFIGTPNEMHLRAIPLTEKYFRQLACSFRRPREVRSRS